MHSNEFIHRTQEVRGFFSTFLLFLTISVIVPLIDNANALSRAGWLFVVFYATEFIAIISIYFISFRLREGFGRGVIKTSLFMKHLIILLIIQFLLPIVLEIRNQEPWIVEQIQLPATPMLVNLFFIIFIVPIYEEIIFRGCLFNALMYWFNDKAHWVAITVSILFSLTHMQYLDWRAYLLLFIISLVLTHARVKTKGIYLPIALHMAMNGVVALVSYFSILR